MVGLHTHYDSSVDAMDLKTMKRRWTRWIRHDRSLDIAIFIVKDDSVDDATMRMIGEFVAANCNRVKYLSFIFDSTTTKTEFDRLNCPSLKLRGLEMVAFGGPYDGYVPNWLLKQKKLWFSEAHFGGDEEQEDIDDFSQICDVDANCAYKKKDSSDDRNVDYGASEDDLVSGEPMQFTQW